MSVARSPTSCGRPAIRRSSAGSPRRLRWLSAPRVHHELSGLEVLVTEFVDGILCSEITAATDIDPAVVSRRILEVSWWGRYALTAVSP
jgi:hypothetical protein